MEVLCTRSNSNSNDNEFHYLRSTSGLNKVKELSIHNDAKITEQKYNNVSCTQEMLL